MPDFAFQRLLRTPYSEAYVIEGEEGPVGRLDLHYGAGLVHGTLAISDTGFPEESLKPLISALYNRLVLSSDSATDELMVAVYQGREVGYYHMGADEDEPSPTE
jgi:hypothetical protein